MVHYLDKILAFKKSCTEPLVPGLNDAEKNSGNLSCDIILFPLKETSPPPEPLNPYLVSYEDVSCEEPLTNPLGNSVKYDEVAALNPSTSVCIDDVNVLSDEISVLEPLSTPVPSKVLNTEPLTTSVPSKVLNTEPLTTSVPSKVRRLLYHLLKMIQI